MLEKNFLVSKLSWQEMKLLVYKINSQLTRTKSRSNKKKMKNKNKINKHCLKLSQKKNIQCSFTKKFLTQLITMYLSKMELRFHKLQHLNKIGSALIDTMTRKKITILNFYQPDLPLLFVYYFLQQKKNKIIS